MELREFVDMQEFEKIISNWALVTGLAAVAVGNDGKYITKCYHSNTDLKDFQIEHTLKGESVVTAMKEV